MKLSSLMLIFFSLFTLFTLYFAYQGFTYQEAPYIELIKTIPYQDSYCTHSNYGSVENTYSFFSNEPFRQNTFTLEIRNYSNLSAPHYAYGISVKSINEHKKYNFQQASKIITTYGSNGEQAQITNFHHIGISCIEFIDNISGYPPLHIFAHTDSCPLFHFLNSTPNSDLFYFYEVKLKPCTIEECNQSFAEQYNNLPEYYKREDLYYDIEGACYGNLEFNT